MKYQITLTEEQINTVLTALREEYFKALANNDPYGKKYLTDAIEAVRKFEVKR